MHKPIAVVWVLMCASAAAIVLKPMQQSWEFDLYAEDGQIKTFPVYEQCETMHLKWDRGTATGATTPYSLVVYTSRYTFPFILDLLNDAEFGYDIEVPFPPGTQMQICMFDANGYTGGCSSVVSIVPSTTEPSNTCTNETFSRLQSLDVEANIVKGPLSRTARTQVLGYPSFAEEWDGAVHSHSRTALEPSIQCDVRKPTELQLDGLSIVGYTLLHILTKATFDLTDDWKVMDAERNVWSYGLLHSGEGTTSCMAKDPGAIVPSGAAAGAGAGAALLGFVIGALGVWIFLVRRHLKRSISRPRSVNLGSGSSSARTESQTQLERAADCPPTSQSHARSQSARRPRGEAQSGRQDSGRNIYVVHSDGGAAPVRVYYENEEEGVAELLPNYAGGGGPNGASENAGESSRGKRKDGQLPQSGTSPLRAREAMRKPVGR
ncbi:hypothetical protein FB107DRAFT_212927 [Schizophyllum commune]